MITTEVEQLLFDYEFQKTEELDFLSSPKYTKEAEVGINNFLVWTISFAEEGVFYICKQYYNSYANGGNEITFYIETMDELKTLLKILNV